MSSFVINPLSISQEEIKADLLAWIEDQPDFDAWSSFYQSTSGRAFIDLSAGLMAFLKYDSMMARREAYLQFAQNRASVIAGGQFLGYSAFRGRNAVLSITFTPLASGVLTLWQEIGLVKSLSMLVLTPTAYTIGVPVTVQVLLGNVMTQTLIAPNDNLNAFRFTTPKVSDDLRIFVDAVEVGTSTEITDLVNGFFAVQTNPIGSIDAKYLNLATFTTQYAAGSEIELQWIELNNLAFDLSEVALDELLGTLDEATIVSLYRDVETTMSIQVNAPLDNETKNAIRGRNDMQKIYKKLNSTFVDAKGIDVSAAIVKVFGLISPNYLRLDQTEKQAAQDAFLPFRMHGLQPPIIGDPSEVAISLAFQIYLNTEEAGDVEAAVDSILAGYMNILEPSLNLFDIENSLISNSFIRIARVRLEGPTWNASTYYPRGQLLTPPVANGFVYKVMELLYKSGVTEPVWPLVEGEVIRDGDVEWTAVENTNLGGINDWVATSVYRLGNEVKPTVDNGFTYVCTYQFNDSGATEPVWSPLAGGEPEDIAGTKTVDKGIIWVARPLIGTPVDWAASTDYKVGDIVVATNPGVSDTVGVMFQAVDFRRQSGASIPAFPVTAGLTIEEGHLKFLAVDPTAEVFANDPDQYLTISRTITTS